MRLPHKAVQYAAVIVWLHLLFNAVHVIGHIDKRIWLNLFGDVFVFVVVLLAPLFALLLLSTRWQRSGAWLLTLSMLGAFIFGVVNHFIVLGSDNISQVSPHGWQLAFVSTAFLLAIFEALGTAIGIWCIYLLRNQSAPAHGL
jgi:hypothetical protein